MDPMRPPRPPGTESGGGLTGSALASQYRPKPKPKPATPGLGAPVPGFGARVPRPNPPRQRPGNPRVATAPPTPQPAPAPAPAPGPPAPPSGFSGSLPDWRYDATLGQEWGNQNQSAQPAPDQPSGDMPPPPADQPVPDQPAGDQPSGAPDQPTARPQRGLMRLPPSIQAEVDAGRLTPEQAAAQYNSWLTNMRKTPGAFAANLAQRIQSLTPEQMQQMGNMWVPDPRTQDPRAELLKLPPNLQEAVMSGRMSLGAAMGRNAQRAAGNLPGQIRRRQAAQEDPGE